MSHTLSFFSVEGIMCGCRLYSRYPTIGVFSLTTWQMTFGAIILGAVAY